jgi:hypothetical protein
MKKRKIFAIKQQSPSEKFTWACRFLPPFAAF